MKTIKKLLRPQIGSLLATILLSCAATVCSLLGPLYVGRAVNAISTFSQPGGLFVKNCVILTVVYLVGTLLTYLFTVLAYRFTQNTALLLRKNILNKLYAVPVGTIDRMPFGQTISLMLNDAENVADGLFQLITTLFGGIVTVAGTIWIMVTLNWRIGLMIICVTPVTVLLSALITRKSRTFFRVQQSNMARLNAAVTENFSNQKLISAYNFQQQGEKKLEKINAELFESYKNSMFISAIPNPSSRVVNYVVYGLTGLMGILMRISVGDITSLLLYANQFNKPFTDITSVVAQLQAASASWRRIEEFLKKQEMQESKAQKEISSCNGELTFRNVCFSYQDKPFLTDLNLTAQKGQRIAIVGPTGSGKTTLINLIMRFYEPDAGEILLDGTDIRGITRESLRAQIGMVLQDSFLFHGTIAENIAYGAPNLTREEIVEAAKKAYCHDFIETLAKGYDTVLENNGDIFSQGQKQLLCIARVMAKLPPILILDEATSNIDTRTEQLIQAAFAAMMKGRTSFVIAHRLSTIKDADRILVVRNGSIVEQGTHEQLMAQNGFYRQMYQIQYAAV